MASIPTNASSLVPVSKFYTVIANPKADHNHNLNNCNEAPELDNSADAAELDTRALGLEVSDSEVRLKN